MTLNELAKDVQAAAAAEYNRAANKFGPKNNSPHESFGVIKEEYDEAKDEAYKFKQAFWAYWDSVKSNDHKRSKNLLAEMKQYAEKAAAEWIQVAAMCRKALLSYD